jgi:hypothetical protein
MKSTGAQLRQPISIVHQPRRRHLRLEIEKKPLELSANAGEVSSHLLGRS